MNRSRRGLSCAFGAILLMLGGCVTHTPISEALVFHDSATRPTHEREFGFGLSGRTSPVEVQQLNWQDERIRGAIARRRPL